MLEINRSSDLEQKKCTPNLLPCRIGHDGPVNASERYWKQETNQEGTPETFLRGRKLQGKEIKLPEGYAGVIVKASGVAKPQHHRHALIDGEDAEEEETEILGTLEETGSFDKVVVWGHEKLIEGDDAFVRGLSEWIGFAESIHRPGKDSTGPIS